MSDSTIVTLAVVLLLVEEIVSKFVILFSPIKLWLFTGMLINNDDDLKSTS